jgi:hypothetical protein
MIDWVSAKFNGVSVTRNSYYNHLMMNERIKQYNTDKYNLYGDILNHSWDTGVGSVIVQLLEKEIITNYP